MNTTPAPDVLPDLPDAIRVPIHRIWADAGYLVGRAIAGDKDLAVHTIKALCDEAERAIRAALASQAEKHAAELAKLRQGEALQPLSDEQQAALQIMLDFYGNDPRMQCLRGLITERMSAPPPSGWRDVLKRARDGLAAGSRSPSNSDFEIEYGGALLDHITEQFERMSTGEKT